MTTIRVTIVGMGPRGLSVLQRMSELVPELAAGIAMELHLVDPGDGGQGVHTDRQPGHQLTNTLASQVTMFAADRGPSFAEWARHRRFNGVHHPTGEGAGETIGEYDYLPRNMLGEYLSSVFDRVTRSLPPWVYVVHHRDRVDDIKPVGSGRLAVRLRNGFEICSDFVFLATGHCERIPTENDRAHAEFVRTHAHRNSQLAFFTTPYPVDTLQRIAPGTTVAVQGLGLTGHDVIVALTLGRGARFVADGNRLTYRPSGREPCILLCSRQCLPHSGRGVNQKGVVGQLPAKFFTREAVQALRDQARAAGGNGQLDFEADVLPLLLREMGHAYRTTADARQISPEYYDFDPVDQATIDAILNPLKDRRFSSFEEFRKFFIRYIVDDLAQAELGNLTSPVKAATDVIRDTRQGLRDAVEFAGLTPESHRTFNEKYIPLMNRISFGPPLRRNAELLALFEAGVVDLAGGPGCRVRADPASAQFAIETEFAEGVEIRHADALVIARVDLFHPESDSSPLIGNLLNRGLIRPFRNGWFRPGGIDIDGHGRPVTATGAVLPNVWALGYLVEGPRFYTYALPRPRLSSQFLDDADTCVRDMLEQI